MDDGTTPKRRRIVVDDEEEEDDNNSLGSDERYRYEERSVATSEEDGEDLMENWQADYAPAPELDYYDTSLLAKDDDPEIFESYEKRMRDRKAAEDELDLMDARRREMEDEAEDRLEALKPRELEEFEGLDEDDERDEAIDETTGERMVNLETFDCPLREWIAEERTRQEIKRRFRKFLTTFYPNIEEHNRWKQRYAGYDPMPPIPPHLKKTAEVYRPKIIAMCAANSSSLEVSYGDLGKMQSLLAIWLTDLPRDMLQIFDEVLKELVLDMFPHYSQITQEVHVRIINLPLADRLRDLRQKDLNNLVRVSGVVTKRTGVFPQLNSVSYDCNGCNSLVGPFNCRNGSVATPTSCNVCQGTSFRINQQMTDYGNYQLLTLQESPGSVPPGRVPRHKDVILLGDLIDIARPGEEIEVTGIYMHYQKGFMKDASGFPVFSTVIEANSIHKKNGTGNLGLSDEDKRRIRDLSTDPNIRERIIRSMAPSIYGHRHVKTAIAMSLFGGCAKEGGAGGTHRVRGDINVLLLGDPGTAKSQVLKYLEKTAPRSVYTTGKGASAVGLTAGVHKDPISKEWTLDGGALVLADQGVCLIDEFDKMNERDRTSIHEAMEQQTISVSKAGIVTSLQARCAVVAAANPIGGRYDPSYTLAENVELTDPILQRFDILCVLQDVVDPIIDEQLALFVVNSHMKSHPDGGIYDDGFDPNQDGGDGEGEEGSLQDGGGNVLRPNPMGHGLGGAADLAGLNSDDGPEPITDQSLLKKYITYARTCVKPVLHDVDREKIASLYADLRKQSQSSGGVPIAVRSIESVVRMAEASARMHLRDHVRDDDVDIAIKVMLESFLQAQKVSVRRSLQKSFGKYTRKGEEDNQLLMHILQGLVLEAEKYKKIKDNINLTDFTEVFMKDLENKAKDLNIYDLRNFYKSFIFRNHNFKVDERRGLVIKYY